MTPTDPTDGRTPATPIPSKKAAKVSFVLAILAIASGAVCIMTGHLPPAIILILAGAAGIMASGRTPFLKGQK